jgi:hypothetical protein
MDPAHGPFVHRAWWWRSRTSIHQKAKLFTPAPLGFTMCRHTPSANSRGYAVLGRSRRTEISFRLPGLRTEHVEAGRHTLVSLTAVTPLSGSETEVHHVVYWTMPWLTLLKPVLRPYIRAFMRQDRDIVAKQQVGLQHAPPLMLIRDADTPARWYHQLKREFLQARTERREFVNPIKEQVLRWQS